MVLQMGFLFAFYVTLVSLLNTGVTTHVTFSKQKLREEHNISLIAP